MSLSSVFGKVLRHLALKSQILLSVQYGFGCGEDVKSKRPSTIRSAEFITGNWTFVKEALLV